MPRWVLFSPWLQNIGHLVHTEVNSSQSTSSAVGLGRPWYLPPGQMPPPNELFPPEPECQIQRGPVRVADNQWQATHSIARKDHALGDFVASPSHNQGQPADQFPSTPLTNDKQISNANFAATHITDLPRRGYHHGKRDHHRVKKRRRHAATHVPCEKCENKDTPEWRRGPNGPATLCNACGLRFAKQQRKHERNLNSTTAELEVPTAAAQEGSIKAYSAHGSPPQVHMC